MLKRLNQLKRLNHKENERLEVEFFEDKECTQDFDFTNARDLYIELINGDITPLMLLAGDITLCTPYISPATYDKIAYHLKERRNINLLTIDDITPNLSKYIPEDNAVLFLSEEGFQRYYRLFSKERRSLIQYELLSKFNLKNGLNFTIFLPHGTQSELQKAEEVGKYLWGNFKIKPDLFVLHCFVELHLGKECLDYDEKPYYDSWYATDSYVNNMELNGYSYSSDRVYVMKDCWNAYTFINKIITTNSTGILKPEDSKECLQVIDCFNIFQDHLNNI